MKFKKHIFSIFLLLCFVFCAFYNVNAYDEIADCKEKIIQYNLTQNGVSTKEEWIKSVLPNDIGISAEWYVLSLSQGGERDFSEYENSLNEYLENKKITSASTRLKFALTLASIGSKSEYIQNAINDSVGKQGIMSLVYGLHFLNNGSTHSEYTKETLISEILSKQNEDGGWSLNGNSSDIDATAMTIQALAKEYNASNENVVFSVDKAIGFLSNSQLDDGDYKSFGVNNPESGAQVIIALSSLNIDFKTDARFIKNGKTLFDGIMKYSLADGSFSHYLNGESNSNSTVQVFCAITAYERMKSGKVGLYILDSLNENIETEESIDIQISESRENTEISEESTEEINQTSKKTSIKVYFIIAICILWLLAIILMLALKKLNLKSFACLTIFAVILIFLVYLLNIQTPEEYNNSVSKENIVGTVSISIDCSAVSRDNGKILSPVEFAIEDGDSVYTILIEASKKYSIPVVNNGSEKNAYISGINGLFEFDCGDLSGWIYKVNGEEAIVGCASYKLKDGDVIEWIYTLNSLSVENKE